MASFPPAVARLPPLDKYSQQDFLDLFKRLLPDHYLQPLIDPGPGYELLESYAALNARVSEAVQRVGTGNYILSAYSGSYSEGTVQFYREATVFGAVLLKQGTIVGTEDGYTYETLQDIGVGSGALVSAPVPVRATVRGWLYDKPGPVTCADGSLIPGSINQIVRPNLPSPASPSFNYDPTLKVRQLTDVLGGSAPMLEGLGADRGLPRRDGETVDQYRVRLTQLPDTVTPHALLTQFVSTIGLRLQIRGLRWWFVEGWDLRVQMCWDATPNVVVTNTPGSPIPFAPVGTEITDFSQNIFVWDYDPVTMPATDGWAPSGWPVSNRLLEAGAYSACLLIAVPNDPAFADDYRAAAESLAAIKPAGVTIYYLFTS